MVPATLGEEAGRGKQDAPPFKGDAPIHAPCRASYAGMTRIRFQGTISTPLLGVPLAAVL